jgi:hypothetical protein
MAFDYGKKIKITAASPKDVRFLQAVDANCLFQVADKATSVSFSEKEGEWLKLVSVKSQGDSSFIWLRVEDTRYKMVAA